MKLQLDPADVQILLLEMQPPIVAGSKTVRADVLTASASTLRTIASIAGLPITASVISMGDGAATLVKELAGVTPVVRSTISALDDPNVHATLSASGRRVLVIGGVSSEIAVLHAVLAGRAEGYEVHVLLDLCGGLSTRTEHAALERMWSAGALPSSVSSLAASLISDMASDPGRSVMQALGRHWGWDAHAGGERGAVDRSGEPAIAAMIEEMQAAWQVGDAKRFASVFSDDARFVAFDGTRLIGADAIAAYHASPFTSYLAATQLRHEAVVIRRVADDVYVVASEGGIVRGEQSEGELIGRSAQTFVIEARDGGLRVTAFQNTRVRPIDGQRAAEVWKAFDENWSQLA